MNRVGEKKSDRYRYCLSLPEDGAMCTFLKSSKSRGWKGKPIYVKSIPENAFKIGIF